MTLYCFNHCTHLETTFFISLHEIKPSPHSTLQFGTVTPSSSVSPFLSFPCPESQMCSAQQSRVPHNGPAQPVNQTPCCQVTILGLLCGCVTWSWLQEKRSLLGASGKYTLIPSKRGKIVTKYPVLLIPTQCSPCNSTSYNSGQQTHCIKMYTDHIFYFS